MLAIANLAFGVAFIVQGSIGMRITRNLPPAVTALDFYRQLLEIEHRRLRVGIPLIVAAAFNLFALPLTVTRFIPSFSSRLLLAVGSVVVYAMFAVYALRRMARKRREIRDLPDDT